MSITNELRESVKQTCWAMTSKAKWFAIADRIDAEHKKAVDIAFVNGRAEGIADGCAYYDTEHTECILSEEHGWIRLPKDANGEYIHIGDVMAYADNTKPMQVVALVPPSVFMVEDGPRYADMCRHYHAPTVEDELTDLCERVWESALLGGTWSDSPVESYIAEYAAKLQLKEPSQ